MDALQQQHLNDTLELYHEVGAIISRVATRAKVLELAVLILSVLTSGSLWLLLSLKLPQSTLWFGALASSFVTGITLYIYSSGMNRMRRSALALSRQIGQFLAVIRASQISEEEFWNQYKRFESDVKDLKYGRHDDA